MSAEVIRDYNIDLSEIIYLASNLSPAECYEFYKLLSHRKTLTGQVSIFADKEKSGEIPCKSLLTIWVTDPEEIFYRSHENVELKLREIGRKDLARWVLGRIYASLKIRRQLDPVEAYQRIEESEKDDVLTHDRIGGGMIPDAPLPVTKFLQSTSNPNEDFPAAFNRSHYFCVFWKIFLSVLFVLFLIVLFAYLYRFVYKRLRTICERFEDVEDKESCLPEQNYGTTRISSSSHYSVTKLQFEKSLKKNFTRLKEKSSTKISRSLSRVNEKLRDNKYKRINFSKSETIFLRSLSSSEKSKKDSKKYEETKVLGILFGTSTWSFGDCNLLNESQMSCVLPNEPEKKLENFAHGYCEEIAKSSLMELSETYDELGMLFSQELKRQSRPCRRKYCPLVRNLRGGRNIGKGFEHDAIKCRTRVRANFILDDERPACSSGNICRETYDEFELMRAVQDNKRRKEIAKEIIKRRREFLDQPCLSPESMRKIIKRKAMNEFCHDA